ncbi:hypothetical protein [Aureimonas leprariae]|uniref:Uncharacterized protein n=1 Tax=Plantimonas leprariae TaxID=2615207 RepID=A0A7V7PL36_9HYPH|nr:hypothetical protein [Aureimonas leprariae]KAB0676857.1 hypothetical protein F6X38_20005 [Aureimonas leprariae]
MRIKGLDIGVESVSRLQVEDEVHLPAEGRLAPAFLPEYRALDSILNRPSLDERLPDLLLPQGLDPDLLEPAVLSRTREAAAALFRELSRAGSGRSSEDRRAFAAAGDLLAEDMGLDEEVRAALALLLRG